MSGILSIMTSSSIFPHRCVCLLFLILEFYQVLQIISTSTVTPSCRSGRYTDSGQCCEACPQGEGAITVCGESNTVCSPCRENVTFSPNWSAEECRPCMECNSDEVTVRRCNLTHDTSCRCKTGLFRKPGGGCSQCNVCPPGYGTMQPCTFLEDIICEECVPFKTFSDDITRATMCKPCSRCRRGFTVVANCTVYSDTVCSAPPEASATPTSASDLTGRPYSPGVSIVPLYCVLLAALVIGLLIYVLFKRWSFHKMKLRASQKMVRSNTSSTDIEKNQENTNGSQVLTTTTYTGPTSYVVSAVSPTTDVTSKTPYKELHSDKKVELEEKLMQTRSDGRDWRALSNKLHFSDLDRTNFVKSVDNHSNPVHLMLHKWQSRDGDEATVHVLVQALKDIRREDLANIIHIRNDKSR